MRIQSKEEIKKLTFLVEQGDRPVEPPLLTGSKKIGPHGFGFSLTLFNKTVQHGQGLRNSS